MERRSKHLIRTLSLQIGLVVSLTLVSRIRGDDGPPIAKLAPNVAQRETGQQLSFADRVAYQYAIEEVYWRHRIWPQENARPKPSLDEVMSPFQVQEKVRDSLRNSQLLADHGKPITPEQLQAEMERMAKNTKQ